MPGAHGLCGHAADRPGVAPARAIAALGVVLHVTCSDPLDEASRAFAAWLQAKRCTKGTRIALIEDGRLISLNTPQEFLNSTEPMVAAYVAAFGTPEIPKRANP